jgi:hypothetical protein
MPDVSQRYSLRYVQAYAVHGPTPDRYETMRGHAITYKKSSVFGGITAINLRTPESEEDHCLAIQSSSKSP